MAVENQYIVVKVNEWPSRLSGPRQIINDIDLSIETKTTAENFAIQLKTTSFPLALTVLAVLKLVRV